MGRTCIAFNCSSGYKSNKTFKGTIHGFPDDPDERDTWVNALPNKIKITDITVNVGVCELHWPQDVPTKPKNRWRVPTVPPSLFQVDSSCCRQTTATKTRNITTRRVSQSARAESAKIEFDSDIIKNWEVLA